MNNRSSSDSINRTIYPWRKRSIYFIIEFANLVFKFHVAYLLQTSIMLSSYLQAISFILALTWIGNLTNLCIFSSEVFPNLVLMVINVTFVRGFLIQVTAVVPRCATIAIFLHRCTVERSVMCYRTRACIHITFRFRKKWLQCIPQWPYGNAKTRSRDLSR